MILLSSEIDGLPSIPNSAGIGSLHVDITEGLNGWPKHSIWFKLDDESRTVNVQESEPVSPERQGPIQYEDAARDEIERDVVAAYIAYIERIRQNG